MRILIDQMQRQVESPDRPQRIISLVPSQTELLHDLGLGDRVVGITKFCIHPEKWFRSKTRIGGTKKLDMENIRALRPDLIIGNKEENEMADILALEHEFPVWMSDVRDLDDALEMIRWIGDLTATQDKADKITERIEQAFRSLDPIDQERTVAYLIWREPYMAAGHDTFINDMLLRCGLQNVFDEGDARYPRLTPQDLEDAGPEVILLSSEPYPFKQEHVEELRSMHPEAAIGLVDGEYFSWYGSRLLHAQEYLNGVIKRYKS